MIFFLLLYFYDFGWFVCEFITIFFWYPDPDQRFLKWIWIRPNDTDPIGSRFETLIVSDHIIGMSSNAYGFLNWQWLLNLNFFLNHEFLDICRTLYSFGWGKVIKRKISVSFPFCSSLSRFFFLRGYSSSSCYY